METGKRTILYGRVSAKKRGRSVDDQLAILSRWAEREGREVVAVLRDDGISASSFAHGKVRDDWEQAKQIIADGLTDELAVWESSRMTRRRVEWAQLVELCAEQSVDIAVDGKVYNPDDPDDMHSLDNEMAGNVRESAKTSKRTLRDAESRATQGLPHGDVHDGLRIEYDPNTGQVARRVIDPDRAAIVREAVARILDGETPTAVAKDFNRRGLTTRTGRQWIGNNLLRQVATPAVAGLRVHQGRVLDDVTGSWPALITVEEHRQLQQILTDPERGTHRNGSHVRFLLVGIGRCAVCEGRLRTLTKRRAHDTVVNYGCKDRFCVSRNAAEVDDIVERLVIRRLSLPDFAAELVASQADPAAAEALNELARLRAKLDEARRLVDADRLSLESLADLEARTLPRIRTMEGNARPRHIPGAVMDTAGPTAGANWAATPIAQRREIVRSLMTVHVDRAPRRGRFSPPADPKSTVRIEWRV